MTVFLGFFRNVRTVCMPGKAFCIFTVAAVFAFFRYLLRWPTV